MDQYNTYLLVYLLISFAVAPLMTRVFFLKSSNTYQALHIIALGTILTAYFLNIKYLVLIWPMFCLWGLYVYFKQNHYKIPTHLFDLTGYIPFIFSIIGSVWLLGRTFDLKILGYDPIWSTYAALHSNYLGWLLIGCFVFISKTYFNSKNNIYAWASIAFVMLFLCVAFGIYKYTPLKIAGTLGLSILTPILIAMFLKINKRGHSMTKIITLTSVIGILFSMALALGQQFSLPIMGRSISGIHMITTHGLINACIVPLFFLAIFTDTFRDDAI